MSALSFKHSYCFFSSCSSECNHFPHMYTSVCTDRCGNKLTDQHADTSLLHSFQSDVSLTQPRGCMVGGTHTVHKHKQNMHALVNTGLETGAVMYSTPGKPRRSYLSRFFGRGWPINTPGPDHYVSLRFCMAVECEMCHKSGAWPTAHKRQKALAETAAQFWQSWVHRAWMSDPVQTCLWIVNAFFFEFLCSDYKDCTLSVRDIMW